MMLATRRLRLAAIYALACPGVALGHDPVWSSTEIVAGINADLVPTGVAARHWYPTGETFFVYDLADVAVGSTVHDLEIQGWECTTASCTTITQTFGPDVLGSTLLVNEKLAPGLAIRAENGNRLLHAVRRAKVNIDCDNDSTDYDDEASSDPDATRMDLGERIWSTGANGGAGGEITGRTIVSNDIGVCEDNNVPFARWLSNRVHACWTHKTWSGLVEDNEIWCDYRNTATVGIWNDGGTLVELPNGGDTNDHSWFAFGTPGPDRIVVHRNQDADSTIHVRFIDRVGTPTVELDDNGGNNDADYPMINIVQDDLYKVVYHNGTGGASDELWLAECDEGTDDCTDPSDWHET